MTTIKMKKREEKRRKQRISIFHRSVVLSFSNVKQFHATARTHARPYIHVASAGSLK